MKRIRFYPKLMAKIKAAGIPLRSFYRDGNGARAWQPLCESRADRDHERPDRVGRLAPMRILAAREIDMAGAKTNNTGEWGNKEVQDRAVESSEISSQHTTNKPARRSAVRSRRCFSRRRLRTAKNCAARFKAAGF